MLLVGAIALLSAALVILNVRTARRREHFVQPEKPSLYYSAVQIICGDCSGEAIMPMKTFMDRHGNCERCGGSSYVLASEVGIARRALVQQRGLQVVPSEAADRPRREPMQQPALEPVPQMKIAV